MSDQKPDPSAAADDSAEPKKEVAGKLAAKQMTILDQIFIWSMVLLVGVLFGIGPSLSLVMKGSEGGTIYKVDSAEVQRRQRIGQALQEMLNPFQNPRGPMFIKSPEEFARTVRKAELAGEKGLAPSKTTMTKLVDEFLARKVGQGPRTFGQMIADHRRAKDIKDDDLELWLGEEFACQALDVASTAAPAMPAAVAAPFKALVSDMVITDLVVLSSKPLLPDIKADDADFKPTYDRLAALNRFTVPAATVVQVAAPDFDTLLKAQSAPSNEQALIWYTGHLDDKVVTPESSNGQTVPPRAFEAVKAEISEILRREGAVAKAQEMTGAFADTVEAQNLEQGDGAAFTKAATAAGLIVRDNVKVADSSEGDVILPEYGQLKRAAREIGLATNKIGLITDQQQLNDGRWVVLRVASRTLAANKPVDDPEVVSVVVADIAKRRAYPQLLKEAEELRAKAEKEGPGGLRKLFSDPAIKAKWQAEVISRDMSLVDELEAPKVPEAATVARGETRLVASLAVAGNPVALCDGESQAELPESIRLVQASGFTAATPPTAEERGPEADRFRQILTRILSAQAEEANRKKL